MFDEKTRGSDRIFEVDSKDNSNLAEAIGISRSDYEVKWWWKYGTPAFIDHIKGGLHVKPDQIGDTLQHFLDLNRQGVQVSAQVFPLGITNPDLFQVDVELRRVGRG